MKKGFFALAAGILLLIACNQATENANEARKDDASITQRNSDHTREIYKAIQSGDVSKLDSFITNDVIDHEGNNGKDIVGLDSLKHYLGNIHNYFDNMKMDVVSEATSPDGDYHFSLVRMTGKAKENPWGMPVGHEMDDMGIDLMKIRDGKISEHWSFTSMKDMMEMMQGMGSGTPPVKTDTTKK
jgi:predicted SnoaL-like aldol condensation-catalyzing enzyme